MSLNSQQPISFPLCASYGVYHEYFGENWLCPKESTVCRYKVLLFRYWHCYKMGAPVPRQNSIGQPTTRLNAKININTDSIEFQQHPGAGSHSFKYDHTRDSAFKPHQPTIPTNRSVTHNISCWKHSTWRSGVRSKLCQAGFDCLLGWIYIKWYHSWLHTIIFHIIWPS